MTPIPTVQINLHLQGNYVSSKLLMDSLQMLEDGLYRSDLKEIDKALKQLNLHKKIIKLIRKRAYKKIDKYYERRLGFHTAQNGSIILSATVISVGYFILKDIVGEFLKDSIKESDFRMALQDNFTTAFDQKVVGLTRWIEKRTMKMKERKKGTYFT